MNHANCVGVYLQVKLLICPCGSRNNHFTPTLKCMDITWPSFAIKNLERCRQYQQNLEKLATQSHTRGVRYSHIELEVQWPHSLVLHYTHKC